MGNLTKNISRRELTCKCGNCKVTILPEEPVIQIVQDACDHFAALDGSDRVILKITSAARCFVWNRTPVEHGGPGSNDNSQHPRCRAMDIQIFLLNGEQVNPQDVFDYFVGKFLDKGGLGNYERFTHVDTRPKKARWYFGNKRG